jgi:hypothetical protein
VGVRESNVRRVFFFFFFFIKSMVQLVNPLMCVGFLREGEYMYVCMCVCMCCTGGAFVGLFVCLS